MTDDITPEQPTPEPTPLEQLADYIYGQRGSDVIVSEIQRNELILTIKRDTLIPFLTFLRDDANVDAHQLMDICGVDYLAEAERFTVVYQLLSLRHNHRLRVKVTTAEDQPVPSVVTVFPTANWFEREVYDLFGIYFAKHPDLRRLLTDYGFDGHPLRKDFPMTGFVEVRYDPAQSRVAYEPVKLVQDYRNFDFTSPWEGMTDVQLPGDEKATKPKVGWVAVNKEVR
jgi:NADH-quinone oxidoreductase subunit C